ARAGVGRSRPVVDALPGELGEAPNVQLAIRDAGRDEDAAGAESAASRELDDPARPLDAKAGRVLKGEQLGAEAAGLIGRAPREIGAAQACWEPEIVFDQARLAGLPAGRLALDHDRLQPLRRSVHRGGKPGWAAAHDHEVVVV